MPKIASREWERTGERLSLAMPGARHHAGIRQCLRQSIAVRVERLARGAKPLPGAASECRHDATGDRKGVKVTPGGRYLLQGPGRIQDSERVPHFLRTRRPVCA